MNGNETTLQTAYYTLMNGNITYDGVTVPVYDAIPSNPVYPHIKIGERTGIEDSNKSYFGENVTQTITITDRFGGNFGSRKAIYSIANQIKQIVRVRPDPFSLTGFNNVVTKLDNEMTWRDEQDSYIYFYQSLRFRHFIQQLT